LCGRYSHIDKTSKENRVRVLWCGDFKLFSPMIICKYFVVVFCCESRKLMLDKECTNLLYITNNDKFMFLFLICYVIKSKSEGVSQMSRYLMVHKYHNLFVTCMLISVWKVKDIYNLHNKIGNINIFTVSTCILIILIIQLIEPKITSCKFKLMLDKECTNLLYITNNDKFINLYPWNYKLYKKNDFRMPSEI
jgi:hypothetical protein